MAFSRGVFHMLMLAKLGVDRAYSKPSCANCRRSRNLVVVPQNEEEAAKALGAQISVVIGKTKTTHFWRLYVYILGLRKQKTARTKYEINIYLFGDGDMERKADAPK